MLKLPFKHSLGEGLHWHRLRLAILTKNEHGELSDHLQTVLQRPRSQMTTHLLQRSHVDIGHCAINNTNAQQARNAELFERPQEWHSSKSWKAQQLLYPTLCLFWCLSPFSRHRIQGRLKRSRIF